MPQIRIGFSTSNDFISDSIRKITQSPVSHCFILINDETLGAVVFQASGGGVGITSLREFEKSSVIIHTFDPKIDISATVKAKIDQYVGKEYDYTGDLGVLWHMFGLKLGKNWANVLHDKGHLFCSEMLVDILQAAKHPGAETLVASVTTPGMLLEFFSK